MHIEDLRQIHDSYDHIYLSPHLDDAALSCGGTIARHCSNGARVLVVTICTAPPAGTVRFSSLAEELHRRWGLAPAEAVTARLYEDSEAMERLGADFYWAHMLDAIYRMPETYNSPQTLFGVPEPHDPLFTTLNGLVRSLLSRTPSATVYAPLGVGNHVDHQITYTVALDNHVRAFYEDFPYVARAGALEQRFSALAPKFVASTIDIDATLSRKIGAVNAYASQIPSLFGDDEGMTQAISTYAEQLRPDVGTYGERIWICDVPQDEQ